MKSLRKKLEEKLWKLCQEYIRLRDGMICSKCKKHVSGNNCHTSHVIPKSQGNILKYDEMNLKLLCYHCHINWWHKNPLEAYEWFKSVYPERYDYLMSKKEERLKLTEDLIQNLIANYKTKIQKLIKRNLISGRVAE